MKKSIRVFAPATVSNVGCGFDVMGFALDQPGDEVILELTDQKSITIDKINGDDGRLPMDSTQNTVGVAVSTLLQNFGISQGVRITLNKKMPFGSGLGSSAASAVAGVIAINQLLDRPATDQEMVSFAMEAEKTVSGTAHADNVAPSLMGGFVLIRNYQPLDLVKIPTPPDLHCLVVYPHIEINTKEARKMLGSEIPLKDAIRQWGNVGGLIMGLMSSDFQLIGRSLEDAIAEPVRSGLIPGYRKVKEAALQAGVLGCNISGSGPSIFALTNDPDISIRAGEKMTNIFDQEGIPTTVFTSFINQTGPAILD